MPLPSNLFLPKHLIALPFPEPHEHTDLSHVIETTTLKPPFEYLAFKNNLRALSSRGFIAELSQGILKKACMRVSIGFPALTTKSAL